MKLLVFATYEEAYHSIKRLKACQFQDHYVFEGGMLLITGIGPFAAYTCLEKHIDRSEYVYNLGLAGSLQKRNEACYDISLCSKYRWHPKNPSFEEAHTFEQAGLKLCTLDFPLRQAKTKEKLALHFDLVDMEGYAISLLAKRHNKACRLIKAVSDFCDKETPKQIQKKINAFSEEFALYATGSLT